MNLTARDQAEDLFDHRFKEAVLDCENCNGTGWIGDAVPRSLTIRKCGKCQGGEIYVALCIRCKLDSNHCKCKVADFQRV